MQLVRRLAFLIGHVLSELPTWIIGGLFGLSYFFKNRSRQLDRHLLSADALATRYLSELIIRNVYSLVLITFFTTFYAVFSRELLQALTVFASWVVANSLYMSIVFFRTKNQYFGTNGGEAKKLIQLLLSIAEEQNGPPTIRRLHPARTTTGASEAATNRGLAGGAINLG